MIFGSVLFKFY